MPQKKYNILDLFSGAGGFSLGFSKVEGFEVKLSIDNNPKLSETYQKNFQDIEHHTKDIMEYTSEDIMKLNKIYNFDIIIGGPPCQGFSLAGNIGREETDDPRNNLFLGYLKFVRIIQPEIFVMENVATLISHSGGKTLESIISCLREEGYYISYKILNAKNYGVAQDRRRIFIVGSKTNLFKFPNEEDNLITIKDVIDDLPHLYSGELSVIPNHNAMNHSEQMLEKMSYIPDGGNRNSIPKSLRPKSGDIRKYIRYASDKPSICITGDMRKVFHYNQNRALTNRELARIQSFPDDYIFYGNSTSIQQQIGNAVPPILAEKIAMQVKEYLNNV